MLPKIDSNMVQEVINFIKNLYYKTDTNGIIIGLSGGIDSTVVLYLLKKAIEKDNIYSYHLKSSTTPEEDTEHARWIAKLLDISYREICIDNISTDFLNLVSIDDDPDIVDISKDIAVEGNINARLRMTILYYFANLKDCLVAGTNNKSEVLIGYFTKYGDGACDFEPIGNIYKTQIKILAEDLNIPNDIIKKPPRAGLRLDQTDEDEIGLNYDVLDKLLYLIVDKKLDNDDILKEINISSSKIDALRRKIANNKHKIQCPLKPF